MRIPLLLRAAAAAAALLISHPLYAQAPEIGVVKPTIETGTLTKDMFDADAADPAVWVAPGDASRSLVVTAVKNGGVLVYDLKGKRVQFLRPARGSRIDNVDVVYGLKLWSGTKIDAVIASDSGLDVIRVFVVLIERSDGPLFEITARKPSRAFPKRPKPNGRGLEKTRSPTRTPSTG